MIGSEKDFDFLFNPRVKKIAPAAGRVLISEPFLQGQYFARSVILITEHNEEGSMGLVLNKPLSVQTNEVVDLFPSCHSPIYLGGPVHTDHLFYIHTLGHMIPKSHPLGQKLFWGGDLNVLQNLLKTGTINSHEVKFFTGASGWGYSQLKEEIDSRSWTCSILPTDTIMNTESDKLWEFAVKDLGKPYRHWIHFPIIPSMN